MSEVKDWAEEEPSEEESAEAALQRLDAQKTLRALRREVRGLSKMLDTERERNAVLIHTPDPPAIYRIPKPKESKKNPIATIALASDLHVEEVVDPKTVNGLNESNLALSELKLERYWQNVVKLCKWAGHKSDHEVHVQWLGGDFFTGHIHEELVETTELAPIESVLWLRERITGGLKYLLKNLQCPILVPTSYGNHGRTTMKPRISTGAEHSYEYLLYQMLADPLHGPFTEEIASGRLKFLVSRGYHQYVDLGGFMVRFHHGDGIRYAGGVGGIAIPLRKATDAWNVGQHADLDCYGHFHQMQDLGWALGNGSLVGYNAYALHIKARYEPPVQAFAMIDLVRKMKTGVFPVFVE